MFIFKDYRRVLSYLYLYSAYIAIFYDFAYNAWVCDKPLTLVFIVIFRSAIYWILYIFVNHLLIRKYIKSNVLIIFESTLFVALFSVLICYAHLWNC